MASRKTVYIETTIPSFYHEVRQEPEMVARKRWTREWWKSYRQLYQLTTSDAVLAELEEGEYPAQQECIDLLADIPRLTIDDDIADVVDVYVRNRVMPLDRVGDALHLALASYHKCDFVLTWNCRHLANANKFEHIRIINARMGLFVPVLVTPMELCLEVNE